MKSQCYHINIFDLHKISDWKDSRKYKATHVIQIFFQTHLGINSAHNIEKQIKICILKPHFNLIIDFKLLIKSRSLEKQCLWLIVDLSSFQ